MIWRWAKEGVVTSLWTDQEKLHSFYFSIAVDIQDHISFRCTVQLLDKHLYNLQSGYPQ